MLVLVRSTELRPVRISARTTKRLVVVSTLPYKSTGIDPRSGHVVSQTYDLVTIGGLRFVHCIQNSDGRARRKLPWHRTTYDVFKHSLPR